MRLARRGPWRAVPLGSRAARRNRTARHRVPHAPGIARPRRPRNRAPALRPPGWAVAPVGPATPSGRVLAQRRVGLGAVHGAVRPPRRDVVAAEAEALGLRIADRRS